MKLFKMMMRFELALKEYGFTYRNGNVPADWKKFANEFLKADFYDDQMKT